MKNKIIFVLILITQIMLFSVPVFSQQTPKSKRSQEFKVRDDKAKLALQKAFPNHKIVQIDIEGYNHDGAGFHCVTLNQPKVQ